MDEQWFYFGVWAFAIHEAKALITARPRATRPIDVPIWANAYGLDHLDDPDQHTINLIGPTRDGLNRDHAMTTDLTEPVLIALLNADGEHAPLLIDGVHRLYRAWREGRPQLAAYLLSVAETDQVKHDRTIGGGISQRRRSLPRRDR